MASSDPDWRDVAEPIRKRIIRDGRRGLRQARRRMAYAGLTMAVLGMLLLTLGALWGVPVLWILGLLLGIGAAALLASAAGFTKCYQSMTPTPTRPGMSVHVRSTVDGELTAEDLERRERQQRAFEAWLQPNAKVFFSYRRTDSSQVVGRIYDRVSKRYGRQNVFKDVDSIPLGHDFVAVIREWIAQTDVVLVLIGEGWLNACSPSGRRRLDDESDFVRIEIATALRQGKPLVPLLICPAEMPAEAALPASIQALRQRNALLVRPDPDFDRDMERLLQAIDQQVRPAG